VPSHRRCKSGEGVGSFGPCRPGRRSAPGGEEIAALPEDVVTREISGALQGLADRVQGELDGGGSAPFLAEAIALGAREPNEDYTEMMGMALVATEWDVDSGAAADFLTQ
jgi:hypothetical protein